MTDWLTECYGIKVERVEVPRPSGSYIPLSSYSGKGVLHTLEFFDVDAAVTVFRKNGDPPHFTTGEGRILQHRPLTAQAAALRTGSAPNWNNGIAQVQIETAAQSKTDLWLFMPSTLDPTVKLLATLADPKKVAHPIPLQVPNGWPDDCHDMPMPWAANNKRRQSELFYTGDKGWYEHLEVPDQSPTWHWDCGSLQRSAVLAKAQALLTPEEEDWMATLFDTQDEFKNAVREALVGSKSGGGPIISAADAGFGTRLSAAIYHHVADKIGSNKVDDVAAALMAKLGF